MNRSKINIKDSIFINILMLIAVVFIIIIVSFNIVVNNYIDTSTTNQLKEARQSIKVNNYLVNDNIHISKPGDLRSYVKMIDESIRTAQIKSKGEVFLVSENYNILASTNDQDSSETIIYDELFKLIEDKSIDMNNEDIIKLETKYSKYYLSFIPIKNTSIPNGTEHYIILCSDVGDISSLANTLNKILFITMSISGILAGIMANFLSFKISRPIKDINQFAKRIGDGDFKISYNNFKEKELDELNNTMNLSANKLETYDKEQKIFFQNVSHELRTPLMSIKGYAEAIKYNVIDSKEASDIILEESSRLTELVESLLYISKIDNITKDYEKHEYDIREILSSSVSSQKIRAMKKDISFIFEFDEEEVMFVCNEKNMYRAFLNIIENALRYSKHSIIISCNKVSNKIIISIENDGEHISKDDIGLVFDRFYKGKDGRHGIGLSIVKSIVNDHGGSIQVENTSIGVKFTIELIQKPGD